MPDLEDGRKPWHRAFIVEYLNNGNNATQAYLAVKPSVLPTTANVNGTQLLSRTSIKNALANEMMKREAHSLATTERLLVESEEIRRNAMILKKKDLGNALKAVELKGKLAHAFTKENQDDVKFQAFIENLQVNINTKE